MFLEYLRKWLHDSQYRLNIYTYNDLSEMVKIINEALKIMFKYLKWDIIFKNVIPV